MRGEILSLRMIVVDDTKCQIHPATASRATDLDSVPTVLQQDSPLPIRALYSIQCKYCALCIDPLILYYDRKRNSLTQFGLTFGVWGVERERQCIFGIRNKCIDVYMLHNICTIL